MFSSNNKFIKTFVVFLGLCFGSVFAVRNIQEIKKDILTTIGEKQHASDGPTIFDNLMNEAVAAGMPVRMFGVLKTRGARVGFTFNPVEEQGEEEDEGQGGEGQEDEELPAISSEEAEALASEAQQEAEEAEKRLTTEAQNQAKGDNNDEQERLRLEEKARVAREKANKALAVSQILRLREVGKNASGGMDMSPILNVVSVGLMVGTVYALAKLGMRVIRR